MKAKTRVKAGRCYPGYPSNNRWAWSPTDGRWICTCTTDYGCQVLYGAAQSAAAPPGQ